MGTGPRNKVRGRSGRVLGRSVAEFEGWGGKYSCQADDFGPFSLFSRHFWRFRKLYDVHLVRRIYGREARKQGSFRLNWSLREKKKLKLISQTTFLISQTSLEKKLKTLKYREATGKLSTLLRARLTDCICSKSAARPLNFVTRPDPTDPTIVSPVSPLVSPPL